MNDQEIQTAISPDWIIKNLKDCPFCSGQGFFRSWEDDWDMRYKLLKITCDGCGASGAPVRLTAQQIDNNNFQEAYTKWNTRGK